MIHKKSERVNLMGVKFKESLFEIVICLPIRKRELAVNTPRNFIWYAQMGHCSHKSLHTPAQHVLGIDEKIIKGAKKRDA